jgi:hypothetical protein
MHSTKVDGEITHHLHLIYVCTVNIHVVMYCGTGSVLWSRNMNDDEERREAVLVFERKIFRRIYGPRYENGKWKTKTN